MSFSIRKFLILLFFIWAVIAFFAIAFFISRQFVTIEFLNDNFETIYEWVFASIVLFSIVFILAKTIKQTDSSSIAIAKVFIVLFTFFIILFIIAMNALTNGGMCAWSKGKVLYENINDSSIKIVDRDYGCGATDSSAPFHAQFKTNEIAGLLIVIADADTSNINKSQWRKIKNQY